MLVEYSPNDSGKITNLEVVKLDLPLILCPKINSQYIKGKKQNHRIINILVIKRCERNINEYFKWFWDRFSKQKILKEIEMQK